MSAQTKKTEIKITRKMPAATAWRDFLPPNPNSPVYENPKLESFSREGEQDPDYAYLYQIYRDLERASGFSYQVIAGKTRLLHEGKYPSTMPSAESKPETIKEGITESKGEEKEELLSREKKNQFVQTIYDLEKEHDLPQGTSYAFTQSGLDSFSMKISITNLFIGLGLLSQENGLSPDSKIVVYDTTSRKLTMTAKESSVTLRKGKDSEEIKGSNLSISTTYEVSFDEDGKPVGDLLATSTLNLRGPNDRLINFLSVMLSNPDFLCCLRNGCSDFSIKTSIASNGTEFCKDIETCRVLPDPEAKIEMMKKIFAYLWGSDSPPKTELETDLILKKMAYASTLNHLSILNNLGAKYLTTDMTPGETTLTLPYKKLSPSERRAWFRSEFLGLLNSMETTEEKNDIIKAFNLLITVPQSSIRKLMIKSAYFSSYSATSIYGKSLPVAHTAKLISQLGGKAGLNQNAQNPIKKRTALTTTAKAVSFALCIGVVLTAAVFFPPLAAAIAGAALLIIAGIVAHKIEVKNSQKLAREKQFNQAFLMGSNTSPAASGTSDELFKQTPNRPQTPEHDETLPVPVLASAALSPNGAGAAAGISDGSTSINSPSPSHSPSSSRQSEHSYSPDPSPIYG
jgi:hypothetical protein